MRKRELVVGADVSDFFLYIRPVLYMHPKTFNPTYDNLIELKLRLGFATSWTFMLKDCAGNSEFRGSRSEV